MGQVKGGIPGTTGTFIQHNPIPPPENGLNEPNVTGGIMTNHQSKGQQDKTQSPLTQFSCPASGGRDLVDLVDYSACGGDAYAGFSFTIFYNLIEIYTSCSLELYVFSCPACGGRDLVDLVDFPLRGFCLGKS